MGVAPPDPVDLEPVDSDLKHLDTVMINILFINFWFQKIKNNLGKERSTQHTLCGGWMTQTWEILGGSDPGADCGPPASCQSCDETPSL